MLTPLALQLPDGGKRVASSAPTLDGEALVSLDVGFPSCAWAGLMRKPGGKSKKGRHVSMLAPQIAALEQHCSSAEELVAMSGAELYEELRDQRKAAAAARVAGQAVMA